MSLRSLVPFGRGVSLRSLVPFGRGDVTIAFVELNGYRLSLSQDEAYSLVMQVVQRQMAKEELSAFLQQHLQPR